MTSAPSGCTPPAMRTLPIHLAPLGFILGLAGCPSDDTPRAPDDSNDPGPADDGGTGSPAEAGKPDPGDGDGDGDTAAPASCETQLEHAKAEAATCKAALAACEAAGK